MKRKFNYIIVFPKIIFRYFLLKVNKTKFIFHEFRPTNSVCINKSLNQLVWSLENFIYLTINNSTKIYFNSGEHIFKCEENKTSFILKVHTINGSKKFTTKIKILDLTKKEFRPSIKTKSFLLKNKTPVIIANKIIGEGLKNKLNQNIKNNEPIINQEFKNFSIIEKEEKIKSNLIKLNL